MIKSCERDKKESQGLGEYEPASTNASVHLGARAQARSRGDGRERMRGRERREERDGKYLGGVCEKG